MLGIHSQLICRDNQAYVPAASLHTSAYCCNKSLSALYSNLRIRYSAFVSNPEDLLHVYSDAVVTTGIHAVCFLYVKGAADSVIWSPDVVLND